MAFPQGSIPGIDVSHNQSVVDWSKAAHAGEVFAFAKATEGVSGTGSQDSYFYDNWQGMKAGGVLRGAYHYYRANDDPKAQADNFLTALAKANGNTTALAAGDLPVALDLEVTLGVDPAVILAGIAIWLEAVAAATGRTPLIYTYPSFWKSIGNPRVLAEYPLWIAEYGVAKPVAIGAWAAWTFWQFDCKDTMSCVTGGVSIDMNAFQGPMADLNALAGL